MNILVILDFLLYLLQNYKKQSIKMALIHI